MFPQLFSQKTKKNLTTEKHPIVRHQKTDSCLQVTFLLSDFLRSYANIVRIEIIKHFCRLEK